MFFLKNAHKKQASGIICAKLNATHRTDCKTKFYAVTFAPV